jgi:hypothetical protein
MRRFAFMRILSSRGASSPKASTQGVATSANAGASASHREGEAGTSTRHALTALVDFDVPHAVRAEQAVERNT